MRAEEDVIDLESHLEAFIRRIVREELELYAARLANGGPPPWLSTEQAAEMLSVSVSAIRRRIAAGWLADSVVKDGRRLYVAREAVLAELERKRNDPNGR